MTEIYLIRHAQAEGNLYRLMQGQWDGGVTPLGLKQIDALAERFRNIPIDALYSSDLYRAERTAGAISRWHDVELIRSKALREINLGPWESSFFGNIRREFPEEVHRFVFEADTWQLDGAETYAEVRERAYAELRRIAERHEGKSVAIVSHGVTLRCLLSAITGVSLRDVKALPISPNTGVSRLTFENGQFNTDYIFDDSHLAMLKLQPWRKNSDLRHESFDPAGDKDYYLSCYADAWLAAHGKLDGFIPEVYFDSALEHHAADADSVMRIFDEDESVGLVDLDSRRGAGAHYGWISLLYLKPEFRHQGYGIQLLGRAIVYYRSLGRSAIRLHVASDNTAAVAFYRRWGFRELGSEPGSSCPLLLMELSFKGARNG